MTLPRPIPMLLAVLGAIVLASTGVGLFLALTQTPPAWFFVSFELVIVIGAVFLIMLGLGRFKEGPAITLLCCAGAIGVSALLGWQATGRQISGHSVTWMLLLRGLVAGLLLLAAAADIVLRNPRQVLPRIGWGVATGAPVLVMLALLQRGMLGSMIHKFSGGSPPLAFGIWLIVGLIAAALISASGHLLITGFQIGVASTGQKGDRPSKTPPATTVAKAAPASAAAPTTVTAAAPQANGTAPSSTPSGTPG